MRYDDDRVALARWEGEGGLVPAEIGTVRHRPALDRESPHHDGSHHSPSRTSE